jgi:diacylglycerol kinase family enzyme
MKVWMLVNQDAGDGVSLEALRTLVERSGHSVLDVVDADSPVSTHDGRADLVAVAGGDGTIAKASGLVARSPTPLAILPVGTANNIARALGLTASIPELIGRWTSARRVPFDLGYARARGNEWRIVEGAGAGLIPAGIAARERRKQQETDEPDDRPAEIDRAVRAFSDALRDLEPRRWSIVIDGVQIVGDFLIVEVLNIPSVGPNLRLSSRAVPTDGYFDVILADHTYRDDMAVYLSRRLEGDDGELSLPRRLAQTVTIKGCDELHIDDERVDTCGLGEIGIRIAPGAITVLI